MDKNTYKGYHPECLQVEVAVAPGSKDHISEVVEEKPLKRIDFSNQSDAFNTFMTSDNKGKIFVRMTELSSVGNSPRLSGTVVTKDVNLGGSSMY